MTLSVGLGATSNTCMPIMLCILTSPATCRWVVRTLHVELVLWLFIHVRCLNTRFATGIRGRAIQVGVARRLIITVVPPAMIICIVSRTGVVSHTAESTSAGRTVTARLLAAIIVKVVPRAAAARRGSRQCGRFWKAKVPRRVTRLMSISGLHDVGATTLRVPGPCTAWDAAKSVRSGRTARQNVERNQTETSKISFSFLGIAANSWSVARAEGAMVPELGAAPERPPRGGHCCAGDVQSRRNGRGPTTDERRKRLPDQHPNGKTNG